MQGIFFQSFLFFLANCNSFMIFSKSLCNFLLYILFFCPFIKYLLQIWLKGKPPLVLSCKIQELIWCRPIRIQMLYGSFTIKKPKVLWHHWYIKVLILTFEASTNFHKNTFVKFLENLQEKMPCECKHKSTQSLDMVMVVIVFFWSIIRNVSNRKDNKWLCSPYEVSA